VPSDLYKRSFPSSAGRDTLKDTLPKRAQGHKLKSGLAAWL
jgi:hypothetical protein